MNRALFRGRYNAMRRTVDAALRSVIRTEQPRELSDACRYVLAGGGKRLRAILVLLSCEAVGGRAGRALEAAAAVEILHNFTLVHDDIMDGARTRRGRPTVHVRWDVNMGLLSGDILLGLAYRHLLRTRSTILPVLADLFTTGVIEVCEGQALDLEFESRSDVTVEEYFGMIEKKTGRLIALSTELGARIGGGATAHVEALGRFGHHLGRAFQIQDDLLDVVADEATFGKAIGGDIVAGKRTFLLLRALERARGRDRAVLRALLTPGRRRADTRRDFVRRVTTMYHRYGVLEEARELVARNTQHALESLDALPARNATDMLRWLSLVLVHRAS
jgi:geranylgeranyl diphosphate synthase type II